jgi:hypothetical protein
MLTILKETKSKTLRGPDECFLRGGAPGVRHQLGRHPGDLRAAGRGVLCHDAQRPGLRGRGGGGRFSPRYFAVKTLIDDSQYLGTCNKSDTHGVTTFHVLLQSTKH